MTSTMEAIRCTVFIDVRLFNTDAHFMVVAHLCKTIIFFFLKFGVDIAQKIGKEKMLCSSFVAWLEDNDIILFVSVPISGCLCFRKKKSKNAKLFHCIWEDSCGAGSRLEGI